MVVELPEQFLKWNYYPRRDSAKQFLEGKHEQNMDRFFLDSTRHNPALCTACNRPDGSMFVNAKIVGVGYVLKEARLSAATEAFKQHLEEGDKLFIEAGTNKTKLDEAMRQYQREAMFMLMDYFYPPKEEDHTFVDFHQTVNYGTGQEQALVIQARVEHCPKQPSSLPPFLQPPEYHL